VQLAAREQAQGFAFPSRPEALASEEKPEFSPAVPQRALESHAERQVPQESLWVVAPGGRRKASGAAAIPGFPGVQTPAEMSVETVAVALVKAETVASGAPPRSAVATAAGFQRTAEAVAQASRVP
jgi:hypothetical protein